MKKPLITVIYNACPSQFLKTRGYEHNQNKLNIKKNSIAQVVYFAFMVRDTGEEKRGNMAWGYKERD